MAGNVWEWVADRYDKDYYSRSPYENPIIAEIGRGGFGVVYQARDLSLERLVALKVLHPQLTVDPRFIENFYREARNLARIHHPNVVTVYEIGEEVGRLFIAMAYLPGGSLADRLKREGPLAIDESLKIIKAVGAGLEAGHKRNVIHRDIKPGNILFGEEGQTVIADFGVARAVQLSSLGTSTQSSGTVGTPFYRPPELWRGTPPPSPATDVYSLACVLYEMLTGEVLFSGDTPDQAERDDQKPLSLQPEGEIRTQPNVSLEQVNLQVDMQQVETGERLLAEDQLDQAVEKLEEAYKIVPEQAAGAYARALFTRGAQRERTGSQEGALQDYHRALEVAPEDELKDEIEISISEIESISTTSSPKTRKLFVWVIGIIVVGIIVVFSISGIFTNQFPPVPTQIIEESEQPSDKIIINAADGWTNTGIVIHQGDLLTVQYLLGLWSPWPGGDFDANGDPNSSITDPANINMRCLHGELIGRIGTKQSFCVGTDYSKLCTPMVYLLFYK
jgi:eukaryotic-like serine/threonine-protein kinase